MPKTKYRADYQPLEYQIKHTDLQFELDTECTTVTNAMVVERTEHGTPQTPLRLDGSQFLQLQEVAIDGRKLEPSEYELTDTSLTIKNLPDACIVTVKNSINPGANKSCTGLYRSDDLYTTQCESESFRNITYFQDRPDNLATYTTTIIADKRINPVLLGNGNKISQQSLPDGKHMAVFEDPIPKPSYLFALVAGDLRTVTDHYVTQDGRQIELNIHTRGDKAAKTMHAMASLKKAFEWDERTYGLPYDLDVYNIVGVPDFNAGAMENKGLNIFNDDAVLVSPRTSTDRDYEWIYTVVGHEFFHNYAGNRVTIKNWFELALKEGLATQKENEFLADMIGYTQPRIRKVQTLKAVQFPEDAGPNAHPVRTESYQEIRNFYTTTTYTKGSELLAMLSGMLGQDVWRAGCVAYFKECDGTAATIDDFLRIVGESAGRDLTQFKRWYSQAGTPQLDFKSDYDPKTQTYTLTVKQSCKPTPDQAEKLPFHIPIKMALLNAKGEEVPLALEGDDTVAFEKMLELTEQEQTFVFKNVTSEVTPSLLRDFSAPVTVGESLHTDEDLLFLMRYDTNEFNRYDAAQTMHERIIMGMVEAMQNHTLYKLNTQYFEATKAVLTDSKLNPGLKADILSFPSTSVLLAKMKQFDPATLDRAMHTLSANLIDYMEPSFEQAMEAATKDCPDEYSPQNAAKRQLKNMCLGRFVSLDVNQPSQENDSKQAALYQFQMAQNLTDKLAALKAVYCQDRNLMSKDAIQLADGMLEQFYQTAKFDPQLMSVWLNINAQYDGPDAIEHLKAITRHESFSFDNPNHIRDLLRVFMRANPKQFHRASGEGYAFVVDCCLLIDKHNPDMASSMAKCLSSENNLDLGRTQQMLAQLSRLSQADISDATQEVVDNAIKGYQARLDLLQAKPVAQNEKSPVKKKSSGRGIRKSEIDSLLGEASSFIGEALLTQFKGGGKAEVESQDPHQRSRRAKAH